MKQFVYKLKLVKKLWDKKNWTSKEKEIIAKHFQVLKKLEVDRRLILAGKTIAEGENGYGVVIFKAEDLKTAKGNYGK